jgi:HSP20 family protein
MSLIRRFDPFAEMSRLQDEMNQFMGTEGRRGAGFVPAVDIYEDKEGFHIKAELPGVKGEDVHVNIENNVLTLRGERKLEREDKREGYHRIERAYGSFTRSFVLPNTADADKVQADLKDGVLTVFVPKKSEAQPRRIEVKHG